MARYKRGRVALYEVMSKAKNKPGFGRTLDKIREQRGITQELVKKPQVDVQQPVGAPPPPPEAPEPQVFQEPVVQPEPQLAEPELQVFEVAPQVSEASPPPEQATVRWWRKPRMVQFNAGRIEFSVSYQIAVAVVLGVVLILTLAFRVGQRYSLAVSQPGRVNPAQGTVRQTPPKTTQRTDDSSAKRTADADQTAKQNKGAADVARATEPEKTVKATGSSVIVLVEYGSSRDLEPVREHFAQAGIATKIVSSGGRYFLISEDQYEPSEPKAARDLEKIKEVGAKYKGKAPEGYEAFAPHYFGDAYLRKMN